jgi:hypothetical protein
LGEDCCGVRTGAATSKKAGRTSANLYTGTSFKLRVTYGKE